MKKTTNIMLAVALLLLGASNVATAQCNDLIEGCSPQAHVAPSDGHLIGPPSHSTCNLCADGNPYLCHSSCWIGLVSPETRTGYTALLAAAGRGEVARVIAFGAQLADHVRYNTMRQAVQVVSCSGDDVVATLPISAPALIAEASKLRHMPTNTSLAFTSLPDLAFGQRR